MEVSGHFQTPSNLRLGNNSSTHWTGAVDPQPGWKVLESTKTLASARIKPRSSSPKLVTVLIMLSWLFR